jgi:glycosyltransferase involved in cell wall biosynthesis
MDQVPILSIITPVYNGEKYIEETITSVLSAKTKTPFEYIVLDDGSTDTTLNIVKRFGNQVILESHENVGESRTVNRGIELAKGTYVLIVNADDPLLTDDLINIGLQEISKDESIVAVYPDWKIINNFGYTTKINILPDYADEIMIGKCRTLPGPGTIFRKDVANAVGGRQHKWRFVGDYDFWLRISRKGKIQRIPLVLAQWRYHENSTSISQRNFEMAKERIMVIEEFLKNFPVSRKLRKNALGNAYYMAARLSFFDSKVPGKEFMIAAIRKNGGIPSETKLSVLVFILLLPISRVIIKMIPKKVIYRLGGNKW